MRSHKVKTPLLWKKKYNYNKFTFSLKDLWHTAGTHWWSVNKQPQNGSIIEDHSRQLISRSVQTDFSSNDLWKREWNDKRRSHAPRMDEIGPFCRPSGSSTPQCCIVTPWKATVKFQWHCEKCWAPEFPRRLLCHHFSALVGGVTVKSQALGDVTILLFIRQANCLVEISEASSGGGCCCRLVRVGSENCQTLFLRVKGNFTTKETRLAARGKTQQQPQQK